MDTLTRLREHNNNCPTVDCHKLVQGSPKRPLFCFPARGTESGVECPVNSEKPRPAWGPSTDEDDQSPVNVYSRGPPLSCPAGLLHQSKSRSTPTTGFPLPSYKLLCSTEILYLAEAQREANRLLRHASFCHVGVGPQPACNSQCVRPPGFIFLLAAPIPSNPARLAEANWRPNQNLGEVTLKPSKVRLPSLGGRRKVRSWPQSLLGTSYPRRRFRGVSGQIKANRGEIKAQSKIY